MTTTIYLNPTCLENLDLSPAQIVIEKLVQEPLANEQQLHFDISYPRESNDPRELSEIPEVRLWFIRLDAYYPWLPYFLDWKSGELARYVAMLVPHQFSSREGIQFNPEALEIFVMSKIFVLMTWLSDRSIEPENKLRSMAQVLGYDIDLAFFQLLSAEGN
ncbi:CRR6 family NdhI maturation factor [Leptolyngbya sp. FACHB-261]|uniref:CRR6 family NdhI maturation factor n=1 Tax=Leptolyngbya sp. FACHB-261 TaxID=2692806 RepID=UPI0016877439|nr:CRR6 family NdhI maturation factor [Leptolyngbya sp. FACHB-261]MBD2101336.1 CRR6 family NdhI maturation factor [Leptolyngbya sp. FACHB-261]